MEKELSMLAVEADAAWEAFCSNPSDNNWELFAQAKAREVEEAESHGKHNSVCVSCDQEAAPQPPFLPQRDRQTIDT